MGGAARLGFAALRAGVEFFDHAVKCAIERRCVVGMRLFSELISVMIHRDPAVGANHWVNFSHFQHLNEAERSPGRIAATPDSNYFVGQIVNRSRVAESSMSEYPRLLRHIRPPHRTQSQIR
jgi:hypothetical protein